MIDVRVHRNFPLNCIKLIIVVWPAWCPVFCLQVLGKTELLEVLEDRPGSSLLAWSELNSISPLLVFLSSLTLSKHVFTRSNFSTLCCRKNWQNSLQNNIH